MTLTIRGLRICHDAGISRSRQLTIATTRDAGLIRTCPGGLSVARTAARDEIRG